MKIKIQFLIPIVFFLIALIDLILRCYYLGLSDGFIIAANDPGKMFFHLFFAPLITFLILDHFNLMVLLTNMAQKKHLRYISQGITVLFASALILLLIENVATDLHQGFCERRATPQDFSDKHVREQIKAKWLVYHDLIKSIKSKEPENSNKKSEDFVIKYKALSDSLIHRVKHNTSDYFWNCNYFNEYASIVVYLDLILTITILAIGFYFFLYLLLAIINFLENKPNNFLEKHQWKSLLVAMNMVFIWVFLRAYSEYYNQFYSWSVGEYEGYINSTIYIALIWILILALLSRSQVSNLDELQEFLRTNISQIVIFAANSALAYVLQLFSPELFINVISNFSIINWIFFYTFIILIMTILLLPKKDIKNQSSFK